MPLLGAHDSAHNTVQQQQQHSAAAVLLLAHDAVFGCGCVDDAEHGKGVLLPPALLGFTFIVIGHSGVSPWWCLVGGAYSN